MDQMQSMGQMGQSTDDVSGLAAHQAAQEPPQMPAMPQEPNPEQEAERNATRFLDMINIAEELDEEECEEVCAQVIKGYQADLRSRAEWEKKYDEWIKLATLVAETKTWPWNKASNVKYPLIATAAMQFSARAYPTLIPSNGKVVNVEVIGEDLQGQKVDRAERLSKHMSYQLLKQMNDWEEDMDKMLLILPIVGTCFKKTYWDSVYKRNCSELVMPSDLVINYWAKSIESAERITERIEMSPRLLKERQLSGVFCDCELSPPSRQVRAEQIQTTTPLTEAAEDDETTPYIILEQHCFLDLDDDGYPEPYIVTMEETNQKLLRIAPRYGQKDVHIQGKDVVRIDPIHYYTKYGFIPNPDGGFYDIGFGLLLGPLNESVNTLINQLVDAGTLSNLQSGFIGKGLRLKTGEQRIAPGEWKPVNATGDDLRKQIVPLPAKEPSSVLFQLLGTLIQSGKELASVAEIFVGKMPGQNTPATTTMATIEQGMKVFTAIYKRIYRSLTKEYKKLFRLNGIYLDYKEYVAILDAPVGPQDYDNESYDVCPAADPGAMSSTEKLVKAQGLMELLPLGVIDVQEVVRRILDAQDQPAPEKLFAKGPPPPDPKAAESQAKMQLEQQKAQMKMQMDQMKAEFDRRSAEQKMMMDKQMKEMELAFKAKELEMTLKGKQMEHQLNMQTAVQQHAVDTKVQQDQMAMQDTQHKQKLEQSDAQHKMKMKQAKTAPETKEKPKA